LANQGLESIVNVRDINGTPLRDIFGLKTGLSLPTGIFVDTENNKLFVANSGNDTITVYRSDASEGNVEPVRTINTALSFPQGIFVDSKNDEIFVTNLGDPSLGEKGKITVFRRGAGKDEGPLRIIEGPDTGLDGPLGIFVVESP
jgi:DNA-binding beta-propeller fold protein YncE